MTKKRQKVFNSPEAVMEEFFPGWKVKEDREAERDYAEGKQKLVEELVSGLRHRLEGGLAKRASGARA